MATRRIFCRVQSCVWRLPKYWPPTPSPPSECVLPPHNRPIQKSELKTKKQDRSMKESELKMDRQNRRYKNWNLTSTDCIDRYNRKIKSVSEDRSIGPFAHLCLYPLVLLCRDACRDSDQLVSKPFGQSAKPWSGGQEFEPPVWTDSARPANWRWKTLGARSFYSAVIAVHELRKTINQCPIKPKPAS